MSKEPIQSEEISTGCQPEANDPSQSSQKEHENQGDISTDTVKEKRKTGAKQIPVKSNPKAGVISQSKLNTLFSHDTAKEKAQPSNKTRPKLNPAPKNPRHVPAHAKAPFKTETSIRKPMTNQRSARPGVAGQNKSQSAPVRKPHRDISRGTALSAQGPRRIPDSEKTEVGGKSIQSMDTLDYASTDTPEKIHDVDSEGQHFDSVPEPTLQKGISGNQSSLTLSTGEQVKKQSFEQQLQRCTIEEQPSSEKEERAPPFYLHENG